MSKGWKRQLTEEAENERADFERDYRDGGCTCFISPPCSFCTHPGNPNSQEGDGTAWEWISPGAQAKIARREREAARTCLAYVGRTLTRSVMTQIWRCMEVGPRTGWGRKTRKWVKMEMRGTYRRRDQWRLDQSAKRVREAADSLARSINTLTGENLTGADFLARMAQRSDLNATITKEGEILPPAPLRTRMRYANIQEVGSPFIEQIPIGEEEC